MRHFSTKLLLYVTFLAISQVFVAIHSLIMTYVEFSTEKIAQAKAQGLSVVIAVSYGFACAYDFQSASKSARVKYWIANELREIERKFCLSVKKQNFVKQAQKRYKFHKSASFLHLTLALLLALWSSKAQ